METKRKFVESELLGAIYYYAFLNENDVVEQIVSLPSVIQLPDYILISEPDQTLIGKKYNRQTGEFEEIMFYYAILDDDDIVLDVVALTSQVTDSKKIEIPNNDKYIIGLWYNRATKQFEEVPIHVLAKLNTGEINTLKSDGSLEDKWLSTKLNETDAAIQSVLDQKGITNGIATLDDGGKVPSVQLPSYVDDVLEFASKPDLPQPGEQGKIYVIYDDTQQNNGQYRWTGTAYASISNSIDFASKEEAEAGVENTKAMTPLRVSQSMEKWASSKMPAAAGDKVGGVKSGMDITVDSQGNVSVNDNSHNHTIANVTGLQEDINEKNAHMSDAVKHVSASEKSLWNTVSNKVNQEVGKGLSSNDYTTAEKNKLAGITDSANKTTIANNLTTTTAGSALDAVQGKTLNDRVAKQERVLSATLSKAGWSVAAPYTQTVNVSGITANDVLVAGVVLSGTADQKKAQLAAWNMVSEMDAGAGTITAICLSSKPTANIALQIKGA